jgi:hypothetical protein
MTLAPLMTLSLLQQYEHRGPCSLIREVAAERASVQRLPGPLATQDRLRSVESRLRQQGRQPEEQT